MRIFGALLFLAGGAGVAWSVLGAFTRKRPIDVAFATLAPLALVVALAGLLLVFVPGFFG